MITAAEASESLRIESEVGAVSADVYREALKAVVAFHAIVDGLPKCIMCGETATQRMPTIMVTDHRCDGHSPTLHSSKADDLPYADALRALKMA